MIQCKDCEYCDTGEDQRRSFRCDPFTNIKEPECLIKWQVLKLNSLIQYHEQLQQMYDRIAPMQEKLFQYMEREIEDQQDAESWKESLEDDLDEDGDET